MVNDFFFARSQMAMSLAFHIVFAALGVGMPLMMAMAEGMHLRTGQAVYLDLCKWWAKGHGDTVCGGGGVGHSLIV